VLPKAKETLDRLKHRALEVELAFHVSMLLAPLVPSSGLAPPRRW
jgi:hypothetical protein